MRAWWIPAFLSLAACKNEQGITELTFEAIAVVTGDFDQVEASLTNLDIGHTSYEGYIQRAVYDPEIQPDAFALKSEQLFQNSDSAGVAEIAMYDAVFVNSGARGFGAYVYNGTEADDSLVTDLVTLEHVRTYVENGGTLVVSDWAYELIEAIWPDAIDFAGDDAVLDDAQRGTSPTVTASVLDERVQEQISDNETVELGFDYSYWTVIESVGPEVNVHMSGDVLYRASGALGEQALSNVPLLVSFESSGGQVLYSSFHWRTQRAEVSEGVMLALLDGLSPGSGDATAEAPEGEDEGATP